MTTKSRQFHTHIVRPRSATKALTAPKVAKAYHYPGYTGKGRTIGIIELGGGYRDADISAAAQRLGIPVPSITPVGVKGAANSPGDEADGEVLLDIQVVMGVAPGASQRVYFAPNTDTGFLAAIKLAITDKVDAISISWGAPETQWSKTSMLAFDSVFAQAKSLGIVTFCASGDQGSHDGTSSPVTDFPASSPNVVACGGTRLTTTSQGERSTEITWDNDDFTSATGGGISKQFLGRNVPDVAGNADPVTGYEIVVNGQVDVIGGTSAVAPLYAGLAALLGEALGQSVGHKTDFMNTLLTNLGVCFDVTSGDNGAYRAGLGRDQVTGLGVVDGRKLLDVLADRVPDPAPVPPPSAPKPVPTADQLLADEMRSWLAAKGL